MQNEKKTILGWKIDKLAKPQNQILNVCLQ